MRLRRLFLALMALFLALGLATSSAVGRLAALAADSLPQSTGGDRWIPFNGSVTPAAPSMVVPRADATGVVLTALFPGVSAQEVTVAGQRFSRLSGEGFVGSSAIGLPDLPVLRKDVEIPFGAKVTLEVVDIGFTETTLAALGLQSIYPVQPSVEKMPGAQEATPFAMDAAFYARNTWYPAVPVALEQLYTVRGHRVQTVAVTPVRYNPATGAVQLIHSVTFRLKLTGSNIARTQALAERYASPVFESALADRILNYNQGQGQRAAVQNAAVGYLIITANAYRDALEPFVQLKESRGFDVTIVRLSDIPATTAAQIKAYIQNAYDNWTLPPSYVLLVGDTDTMPGWSSSSAAEITDLYYGTMDGSSDWVPDIGRGRFPVRSAAQTTIMVNKYLAYAQLMGEEAYLKKAAFLATCDNYTVAEGSHNYVINTHTLPGGYSGIFPNNPQAGGDRLYCITHNADATDIQASLNDGRWAVIYSGHGSWSGWEMDYSQTNVRNLTSTGIFPFVASHACISGDFAQTEVYGETWVLQENKGALVYWGSSDSSYWGEDDILERRMFDQLFTEVQGKGYADVATMTDFGLAGVQSAYPSSARYYWETYNILGDPSVRIFMEPDLPTFALDVAPTAFEICRTGTATATVTINSMLNYSGTVSLSHSALPANVTAAFDPDSATAPYSSTLTLDVATGAPAGAHTVEITATDQAAVALNKAVRLQIFGAEPAAPVLQAPADGATNQAVRPNLRWNPDSQAVSYGVQLDRTPLFTAPLVDAVSATSSYAVPTNLEGGQCYWWRASGQNACGTGAWSTPFHFSTLALAVSFWDDMESGTGNWSHAASQGVDRWALSTQQSHSPAQAWFVPDDSVVTDSRLWTTTPIPVTAGSTLTFWHRYQFEGTTYDGAVLEISTNGTTWLDLGSRITANGYNATISSNFSNPLAGRRAWGGDLTTWTQVTVNLADFAGQNIMLRWRLGCDSSSGDTGWFIDDIQISSPLAPNPAPILTSVVPAIASPSEETLLTLHGENFTGIPALQLGAPGAPGVTWLPSVTVVSSTTLTAVVPAGMAPGVYDLTLFNGDCQMATLPGALSVLDFEPLTGVLLDGPVLLATNAAGTYTAEPSPLNATQPLTFTWDNGAIGATAVYSWTVPGTYTVTVVAEQADGAPGAPGAIFTETLMVEVYQPLAGLTLAGPALLAVNAAGTYTVAPLPVDATQPFTFTWDNGVVGATAAYSWTVPGTYTVTVVAEQVHGATFTETLAVEVYQPLTGLTLAGPALLAVNAAGTYTVAPLPVDATQPFTFTWDNGVVGATAAYSWTLPGTYTVTVVAEQVHGAPGAPGATFTETLAVEVYQPLTGLTINGPAELQPGESGTYTVAPLPLNATLPLTYTWSNGTVGATADYSWDITGSHTITVTAQQVYGASQSATFNVSILQYRLFIPLILRGD